MTREYVTRDLNRNWKTHFRVIINRDGKNPKWSYKYSRADSLG